MYQIEIFTIRLEPEFTGYQTAMITKELGRLGGANIGGFGRPIEQR